MLNKGCQYRRTVALTVAVLFSFAEFGPLKAQTPSPFAGSFEELFPNPSRAAPVFTRPDVISRLPLLPLSRDDSPQSAPASAQPPTSSEPKSVAEGGQQKAEVVAAPKAVDVSRAPEDVVEIRIMSNADGSHVWFDPIGVLVQPGQTIRWVNLDPVYSHTTTAYHPKNLNHVTGIPPGAEPWNSNYLRPRETFSTRLTETGVYDYFCVPHERAGMVGRIVVGQPAGASGRAIEGVALEAGGQAIPEPARRGFPAVAEIMRLGVVHAPAPASSKGEPRGAPVVAPSAERRALLSPERSPPPRAQATSPLESAEPQAATAGPAGASQPARTRSSRVAQPARAARSDDEPALASRHSLRHHDPDRTATDSTADRLAGAHSRPLSGARVQVRNRKESPSVVVRINDGVNTRLAKPRDGARRFVPDLQAKPKPELPQELRL